MNNVAKSTFPYHNDLCPQSLELKEGMEGLSKTPYTLGDFKICLVRNSTDLYLLSVGLGVGPNQQPN